MSAGDIHRRLGAWLLMRLAPAKATFSFGFFTYQVDGVPVAPAYPN